MPTKEGSSRGLTAGEIAIARLLFKDSINYSRVKVHNDEYFPFGTQDNDTAVTPNGEMYWPKNHFREDFSASPTDRLMYQHWFMHEMGHVWQYQLGYNVKMHGLFSWAAQYKYTLAADKKISDFKMEAQASVLADYYVLVNYGEPSWSSYTNMSGTNASGASLLDLYKKVLANFLANPSDKSNLPG